MAHFRRHKPRTRTSRGYSSRAGNERFKAHHANWMCWWPAWHDIIFHRRPHRRRTAELERAVLHDRVDADIAAWPTAKRPHKYYW